MATIEAANLNLGINLLIPVFGQEVHCAVSYNQALRRGVGCRKFGLGLKTSRWASGQYVRQPLRSHSTESIVQIGLRLNSHQPSQEVQPRFSQA